MSPLKRLTYAGLSVLIVAALVVGVFGLYLAISFHTAVARTDGTIHIPGLREPVTVMRDERDIPHISAQNEHDLFFAQGFSEGSDRLFQIDLTRHAVYGRLAEWFGGRALEADERARIIDVRGIVDRQLAKMSRAQRAELQAFSDGVNAAVRQQPLPFEYRLLFIRPEPWRPQDSLAVGFATVLVLSDSYRDVLERDAGSLGMYPLSDSKYDAPTADIGGKAGSNAWAAGALHSQTGRALLANDPHLAPSIPGIWYLVDLRAPGYHVAGASLAGTPGVILGHNDAIAWGATNGSVAAQSVFCGMHAPHSSAAREEFQVRLGRAQFETYFRERRGFYIKNKFKVECLVAWSAFTNPTSPLGAFDGLDHAKSIEDGVRALSGYPGPTQNFVLAQRDGRVAYYLAGWIPNDPAWARYAHRDGYRDYPNVPFNALPHVAASRNAAVWTANNKMYGKNYPYRLSATFEPPYRAYRIESLLKSRRKYDVPFFSQMQADVYSAPDLELARDLTAVATPDRSTLSEGRSIDLLKRWNGRYDPDSIGATVAHDLRVNATLSPFSSHDTITSTLEAVRRSRSRGGGEILNRVFDCPTAAAGPCVRNIPWGDAGAVTI
ncbi:MAG: penicillin acylase family protein, partial [Candidatus Eremiobacteraeota bacterium]|nr:penicillin acylase family protein [Candidatus Eremiobacteraeota bacterium]